MVIGYGGKIVGVWKAWRFGSTVAMPALSSCDKAAVDGWLLFTSRLLMWIDVKNCGYRWVSVVLPVVGVCKGGLSIVELFRRLASLVFRSLASFPIFVLLHCVLLRFMLDFGLFLSCLISPSSNESGLLSRIRTRI